MKKLKLIPPGNLEFKRMVKQTSERKINVSSLVKAYRNGKKLCLWCCDNLPKSGRHTYCSDNCKESAWIHCYPQGESARMYLMDKQNWRCAECDHKFQPDYWKEPRGTYPEVDHIIPIWIGGQSLGVDNHQVLCKNCHRIKTSREASERAELKRSVLDS